jgi:hypothetical protein
MRASGRQSGFVGDVQAIYPFSRLFYDGCHSRLPRSTAVKGEIGGPWVTACFATLNHDGQAVAGEHKAQLIGFYQYY